MQWYNLLTRDASTKLIMASILFPFLYFRQFYIRNLINPQLRTLSLNWCFHCKHDVNKFKALGKLLQKLPNLEKLTLKNFWVGLLS
jgi:hypothetical protein